MPRFSSLPLGRVLAVTFILLLVSGCSDQQNTTAAPSGRPPALVSTERVEPTQVEVEVEYAGRVRGSRDLEVRARVGGILEQRLYHEGQRIEQGAPLFRIDAEPYEILLRQRQAERDTALASQRQSERELRRVQDLLARQAISQREVDNAATQVELAQARLDLAEAAYADAQRQLGYTQVAAPISGVTGLESWPEGSLIEAGTLLTRITQDDPAHVRFALPETDAALLRVGQWDDTTPRTATLVLDDRGNTPLSGEVDFTDATIDQRTGSVSARAVFANPDRHLVPGQFVRIRLVLQTLDEVYLIPASAVTEGPQGPQVWLIKDEQAHPAPVRLGPLVDGKQVILSGLNPQDELVVNGQVALFPSAPIRR